MVAMAINSVTLVLWKETAFPLCRAMKRHWERNVVFCDSGDMPANLLCKLNGHFMPCTSCFYGNQCDVHVCSNTVVIITIIKDILHKFAGIHKCAMSADRILELREPFVIY